MASTACPISRWTLLLFAIKGKSVTTSPRCVDEPSAPLNASSMHRTLAPFAEAEPALLFVFCTKIASKLVRTYTDKHGLKELCKEMLNVDLNKSSQSSDWSVRELSKEQLKYASHDVIYLFRLKKKLEEMIAREDRQELLQKSFDFLPIRVKLDLAGWHDTDIFSH